jgi:hypothetical protein
MAVSLIREALEEESTAKEVANCDISVASQWIIRSGMELYREALAGGPLNDEPGMKATGHLYGGKPGLCPERWQFWKSRFSKVKHEVDKEVAKMVQQAIIEMERAEKVVKKRAMDLNIGEIDDYREKRLKMVPEGYV